jgi:heat-inducible transcriptional repressor
LELTERKKKILRALVELYIQSAEPVGSKALADAVGMKISSATIRNELADLTSLGYLEQPHTSAGRIPSPKGYRLYVNELMVEQKLTIQETQQINDTLHAKMKQLDQVIDQAGRMVSQMTNYPAFALAAGGQQVTITRYDLIYVDDRSFITVLMTSGRQVKNKLIRTPLDVNEPQLQLLSTLLNAGFTGKRLEDMNPELMRVAEHAPGNSFALISLVVSFAIEVLEDVENRSVYTAGVSHLLEHPEYQDLGKAQKLLTYLSDDEEEHLGQLPIPAGQGKKTSILIGPENVAEELKDTSVVLASYDIGDGMKGVIGVVGPTRMDYAKVMAKLNAVADGLGQLFSGPALPQGGEASSDSDKPREDGQTE